MINDAPVQWRFQIKKWDERWWVIPNPFTPNIGIHGPFKAWSEAVLEAKRLAKHAEVKA